MGDIVSRFLNFDKMIGTTLIKIVYFIGLGLIVIGTVLAMLGALGGIGSDPLAAIGGFIVLPLIGLVSIIFWRFVCEIYMLFFKISDDLSDIKALKTGAPTSPPS